MTIKVLILGALFSCSFLTNQTFLSHMVSVGYSIHFILRAFSRNESIIMIASIIASRGAEKVKNVSSNTLNDLEASSRSSSAQLYKSGNASVNQNSDSI